MPDFLNIRDIIVSCLTDYKQMAYTKKPEDLLILLLDINSGIFKRRIKLRIKFWSMLRAYNIRVLQNFKEHF
jgi:hypothetical protein